jgi:hypothetical protein
MQATETSSKISLIIAKTRRNHTYEENLMKRDAKTMINPKFQEKSCCIIEGISMCTEAVEGRTTTIAAADAEYRIVTRRIQSVAID